MGVKPQSEHVQSCCSSTVGALGLGCLLLRPPIQDYHACIPSEILTAKDSRLTNSKRFAASCAVSCWEFPGWSSVLTFCIKKLQEKGPPKDPERFDILGVSPEFQNIRTPIGAIEAGCLVEFQCCFPFRGNPPQRGSMLVSW